MRRSAQHRAGATVRSSDDGDARLLILNQTNRVNDLAGQGFRVIAMKAWFPLARTKSSMTLDSTHGIARKSVT